MHAMLENNMNVIYLNSILMLIRFCGLVVSVHCVQSVLVIAPSMLQSVLWQLGNKTLTLHFAMRMSMRNLLMQSQGHESLHVWLACSVRGEPPAVQVCLISCRLPKSWDLNKGSMPYIIIISYEYSPVFSCHGLL